MLDQHASMGFVYMWVNNLNGRYYIGSHGGSPDDGYIASGKVFLSAYKKYGASNFTRHIKYIGVFYREKEEELLTVMDAVRDELSYNLTVRVRGFRKGDFMTEETRLKFGNGQRGKKRPDDVRARISAAMKGVKKPQQTVENMRRAQTGKKLTEECKKKIREAVRRQYEEGRANPYSYGMLGKKHSDETKKKMSISTTRWRREKRELRAG